MAVPPTSPAASTSQLTPPPQDPASSDRLSDRLTNLAINATRVLKRQSSSFLRIGGSEITKPTQVVENVPSRSISELQGRANVTFTQTNLSSLTREKILAMTVEQRNGLRQQVKELKLFFTEQLCRDRSMLSRVLYIEQQLEACRTEAKDYALVDIITGHDTTARSEKIKEGLCYLPELVLQTEHLFMLIANMLEMSDRNFEFTTPHRENALNFSLCWLQHNKDTRLLDKARLHLLQIASIHANSPLQSLKELSLKLKEMLEPTSLIPEPILPSGRKDFFKECNFTTEFAKHIQRELLHHQWLRRQRLTADCLIKAKSRDDETHPTVQASVRFFNRLFEFTTDFILKQHDLAKCVRTLKFFLKLANLCHQANDFESTYAIITGLNSCAIGKLKKAWNKVPEKYRSIKDKLVDLFDNRENYKRYREKLREVQTQFHIPYLGILQRDLQFLNDSTTIVREVTTKDGEEVYCTDKLIIVQSILAPYAASQKQKFPVEHFRPETDFCMLVEEYDKPLAEKDQEERISILDK